MNTRNYILLCALLSSTFFSNAQNGILRISSGAHLVASGSVNIVLNESDFNNQGDFVKGESTVEFRGSAVKQYITGETDFANIRLNKSNGELELESNISVSDEIDMQSGLFKLNQRRIDLGNSGFISNENATNYIFCECPAGQIIRTGTIGAGTPSDLGNMGLSINPAVPMGETTIIRKHFPRDLGPDFGPSVIRVFDVEPELNNGSLDAELVFKYFPHEENNLEPAELVLFRSDDGITWEQFGGVSDPVSGTVTATGWNQFSEGTAGTENTALPVEMKKISTTCTESNQSQINWTTASELNASHFEILKSVDGNDWQEIGVIAAYGTTSQEQHYTFTDPNVNREQVAYYSIRQVDFDGRDEVFGPYSSSCLDNTNLVEIYPNPANSLMNVSINWDKEMTPISIQLMDMTGKIVKSEFITIQNGQNHFPMNIQAFSRGVYQVHIYSTEEILYTGKVVKQ